MEIPHKLQQMADRLAEGRRINKTTVRNFLRCFGVERRGVAKVQEIRAALDELGLKTVPDFENEWIDAPIWIQLKEDFRSSVVESRGYDASTEPPESGEEIFEEPSAAVEAEDQTANSVPDTQPPSLPTESVQNKISGEDPTYRIGMLPAANKPLVTVNPSDSLNKAVTLMLQHDFSQLPVMQGERDIKGVVAWKSIGSRHALGAKCETVGECCEDPVVVEASRALFEVIPTIVEHDYVLVRGRDRKITGMVTASDLSMQFQVLAEPFLLLREIELHVRQVLDEKITVHDFQLLKSGGSVASEPSVISDLSFGEYVRLIQHPQVWPKLCLRIDNGVLVALLENVRRIRNDVMHFDPDPMTPEELATLKRAVRLLQQLYEIKPQSATASAH